MITRYFSKRQLALAGAITAGAVVVLFLVMGRGATAQQPPPAFRPAPTSPAPSAPARWSVPPARRSRPSRWAGGPRPGYAPLSTATRVRLLRPAPDIIAGALPPHENRGRCRKCHRVIQAPRAPRASAGQQASPASPTTTPASPTSTAAWTSVARVKAPPQRAAAPASGKAAQAKRVAGVGASGAQVPFQEVHWQGLELVTLTPALVRLAKLPPNAKGVLVDEVTLPADTQGFLAGDLVTAVGGVATESLERAVSAADKVRDGRSVKVSVLRKREALTLRLTALRQRLGTANGETAPTIPANSQRPHPYYGPCTTCHRIGKGANLTNDGGDPTKRRPPTIRAGQRAPHEKRGTCSTCHVVR